MEMCDLIVIFFLLSILSPKGLVFVDCDEICGDRKVNSRKSTTVVKNEGYLKL